MNVRSALIVGFALAACAREDVIAFNRDAGRSTDAAADAGQDAGSSGGDAGSDHCSGSGPPIVVGDHRGTTVCGGELAQRSFRFALCACEDYVSSNTLEADAFDSRRGPYAPGAIRGGSIGINGRISANASIRAGGSLWTGSALGIQAGASADLDIAGELMSQGPLDSEAAVRVGLDARVGGALSAAELDVTGTLFLPPAAPIDVTGPNQTGAIVREQISIEPPCHCASSERADIAAYVAAHAGDNDNASAGLDPDQLANHPGPVTLELPCGRYYLTRIGGRGRATIIARGRVALFIAGDVSLDDIFRVELQPGAELDLFIAGNLVSSSPLELGSASEPARVRLYIGGSGTVQLSAGGVVAGNLYAPNAELVASGPIEAFGSIFVRRLAASAALRIHYDVAVLASGGDCTEPPPPICASCLDCGNNACTNGICSACTEGTDCCAPLVCRAGTCTVEF